jgi:hypothetical protein
MASGSCLKETAHAMGISEGSLKASLGIAHARTGMSTYQLCYALGRGEIEVRNLTRGKQKIGVLKANLPEKAA